MKKITKIFAFIAAITMAMCSFSACAGPKRKRIPVHLCPVKKSFIGAWITAAFSIIR